MKPQKKKGQHHLIFFSFFFIPFAAVKLCCWPLTVMAEEDDRNTTKTTVQHVDVDVGVVLDMKTALGKMSMRCISMAASDFYATHPNYRTRLVLHSRDSNTDAVAAASAALDLIRNEKVQAIIGPQNSGQANFMVQLGGKAQVPVLSFSAISSSLSPIQTPYFIRTAQNDSSQVAAIAAIVRAYGWRAVVPVYEDTDYDKGIIPYLSDGLHDIDAQIPYRSVVPRSANDAQITGELYKLMAMQTRVFVLHMGRSLGTRLLLKAREIGMMSRDYVWIITDALTNVIDSFNQSIIDSMQGVLGVKQYVAKSKEIDNFKLRLGRSNFADTVVEELNVFGIRAYDTVTALAIAAETLQYSHNRNPKIGENSTELDPVVVSSMGPKLVEAIRKVEFRGLGGHFHLVSGELQSSVFQIINVIGKGERVVGFWTQEHGISQDLNFSPGKKYSTPTSDLRPIIWPGETSVAPKGWVIPTSGKKLKIAVPIKERLFEFVKVGRNSSTTVVSGYCIDIFKTVVDALPYALPYEFIPYQTVDGKKAGDYDDLVNQVYLQNYDAVVADMTITAKRSLSVDFTLPYTESGVAMVVSIKEDESKKTWIFLKPLTLDLWLTSGTFFLFTGFVVWILEHRINDDFRGPPAQQLGLIFWFSFSTLVFAHKEKVINNLSRFVVIIWVFVVFILTSSYTASLASMLTVQQLQPTITDITDLKSNGEYIGYHKGPFMREFMKHFNFDESKLRPMTTLEEYDEALSKGSHNGGVSAIFDEIPYLRLFLAKHCGKYTMVGPIYKTGGFGFIFSKGSPLVPDVSRAILNVTEGEKIAGIERKWFGLQNSCSDKSANITSNSLTLSSFRGLFYITGIASTSALIIFSISFLYEHGYVSIAGDPNSSIWQRFLSLAQCFDQKESSARTLFGKSDQNIDAGLHDVQSNSFTQTSPASELQTSISDSVSRVFGPPEEDYSSVEFDFSRMPSPEEINSVNIWIDNS